MRPLRPAGSGFSEAAGRAALSREIGRASHAACTHTRGRRDFGRVRDGPLDDAPARLNHRVTLVASGGTAAQIHRRATAWSARKVRRNEFANSYEFFGEGVHYDIR